MIDDSHVFGKPQQGRPTGKGFFGVAPEDLSIREICERANIQSNILDLQSKDREQVKSALNSLSSITRHTGRKDALYAMVGYYKTEIRTTDEIIDFFYSTEMALSSDICMVVLNDLVKLKELGSRRRLFVDDLLRWLSLVFIYIDHDLKAEIRMLIENSAWGEKLKRKFIDTLFLRDFGR